MKKIWLVLKQLHYPILRQTTFLSFCHSSTNWFQSCWKVKAETSLRNVITNNPGLYLDGASFVRFNRTARHWFWVKIIWQFEPFPFYFCNIFALSLLIPFPLLSFHFKLSWIRAKCHCRANLLLFLQQKCVLAVIAAWCRFSPKLILSSLTPLSVTLARR